MVCPSSLDFDIVSTGLDRGFENFVLIAHGGRVFDHAQMLKTMAHRARSAKVAAVLGKRRAHVGGGAIAVVGQRLDDERHACGAVAFVAHFFVVIAFVGRGLVDRALDIVLGHRLRLGRVDRSAQARVHVSIGYAHLGRHGDFARELAELRRALFVLRTLAVHDVLELGMACHGLPIVCRPALVAGARCLKLSRPLQQASPQGQPLPKGRHAAPGYVRQRRRCPNS